MISHTHRQSFASHDPTYAWKLSLRLLSLPLALLSIILYAISTSSNSSLAALIWTIPSFIILVLSIAWNVTNIIVLFKRDGRFIHPGAQVGCDLLLWLFLFFANGMVSAAAQLAMGYTNTYSTCDAEGHCKDEVDTYGPMQPAAGCLTAGVLMAFVIELFHFALFISACRYTHARRQARRYNKGGFEELGNMNRLHPGT